MILAFDTDVLIYAADLTHPLGQKVLRVLEHPAITAIGSCILLPELLSKPIRLGLHDERDALLGILALLELIALDTANATLAAQLGASYKLKAPDAIHLATAVQAGADAFITNNTSDFKPELILELNVLFPMQLEQLLNEE